MTITFVLLIIAAYLLGSVPTAYLVVRWSRGVDIRQYGSGNVGLSNVLKVTSKWLAIPVIIFDVGKGLVVVWLARQLGLTLSQQILVGLSAIVGHAWPLYLRFRGGRGVLTILGVIVFLAPWLGVAALVVTLLFAPFRQMALGTILTLAALPISSWFLGRPFGIEERLTVTLGLLAIFLIAVLRRLTASSAPGTAMMSTREVLLNRVLFDRDIRDREAWIQRGPGQTISQQQPQQPEEKK